MSGCFVGDVGLLAGIACDRSYSSVPCTSRHFCHITRAILLELLPARLFAVLDDEHAIGELVLRAAQESGEADAVELRDLRRCRAAQIDQRRQQVLHLRQLVDVARLAELAGRPADEARGAMAALVVRRLAGRACRR